MFLKHNIVTYVYMCMAQDVLTKPSQQNGEVIVHRMISGQETKGEEGLLGGPHCENAYMAHLSIIYGLR